MTELEKEILNQGAYMTVYYLILGITVVVCGLAVYYDYKIPCLDKIGRVKHSQATILLYFIAAAVLIFVAGFRYYVGTDFGGYYRNYRQYANEFIPHLITLDEPGYRFICWFVVKLGGRGTACVFTASLITCFLFLKTIYKNTNCLFTATLLYLFLGCWHGSFNGVRQYLAAAVIFSGLRFIKDKKFWKYALVVFIAFLFHKSALLMIFAYFVAHNKINLKNIIILVIGSLVILFSFSQVLEFTGAILQEDLSDEGTYLTEAVNIFRVLVALAPAVFFLIVYWEKEITAEQQMWLNLLILNGIMMLATSNSTYLARMGIYTDIFTAIAIPELTKKFSYNNRIIIKVAILLLYGFFWWYEISNSSSLNNFRWAF